MNTAFHGYAAPTSSTTYTPNQFFDVVLPNASRGCLRLVGYLIRKTLGWSDEHGNPRNPEAHVSYRELIEDAGISRGAIKDAIQEALDKRFIQCLRFGQPHRPHEEGFSALYSLKWDDTEKYLTKPDEFNGFFSGNGNLTHIPNEFFDYTIPREPLAVVQVIGVIIRTSIGWQSKFGFRRQQTELSFSDIMRRTGINSRTTVSNAIKAAIEGNHIRRVEHGVFDPNAGVASKATVYALRWLDEDSGKPVEKSGAHNEPQATLFDFNFEDGSKTGPATPPRNRVPKTTVQKLDRSSTVQKADREDSSETEPDERSKTGPATVQEVDCLEFKKRTDIKTTTLNNASKQQQTARGDVVGGSDSLSLLVGKLLAEGIEPQTANRLAECFPSQRILNQIEWLPYRNVRASRTGFLIRAIERDMPAPGVQASEQSAGQRFAAHFYAQLAGNPGEPTAEPSSEDARLSESYLRRLPAKENPEKAGRRFASHVARGEQGRLSPVRTLSLALRLYGDEFYAATAARREQIDAKSHAEARQDHEKRFMAQYEAYAVQKIEELSADQDLSARFEEFTEKKLASRRRMSDRAFTMLRDELQSEAGRRRFFIDFLEQERPGAIAAFWDWDATMNREPFSTERMGA